MDIKTAYEKLNAQIEKLFVGNVWKIGLKKLHQNYAQKMYNTYQ